MADALEVGDQGGQPRPDQAAPFRPRRAVRPNGPSAVRAPTGVAAVLLDLQGHHGNLDLLNDAGVVPGTGCRPWPQSGQISGQK